MDVKTKMNTAVKLLEEVVEEVSSMTGTEKNKTISGLVRVFGKDNFIEGILTLQGWVNDLDLKEGEGE